MIISDLNHLEFMTDRIQGGSYADIDIDTNVALITQLTVPVAIAVSPFGSAVAGSYGGNYAYLFS